MPVSIITQGIIPFRVQNVGEIPGNMVDKNS